MSETRVHPTADDINAKADESEMTEYKKNTFEKRECNRFGSETNQIRDCGYSIDAHCKETLGNESNQTEHMTNTFLTDVFGNQDLGKGNTRITSKKGRYVRLDYKTDTTKILKLFDVWKMGEPDVILSVISDSDCFTDKGDEKDTKVQNNRRAACRNLVKAAASTNAWIITGGLNKGVDQLIGNAVKQQTNKTVLGISNRGRLEEEIKLLNDTSGSKGHASDSNPIGLLLNQHHTHFLLVDDGTQKKSGCECILRAEVESALMKWKTDDKDKGQRKPLIYILIGGSTNAFGFVKRALENEIPVIVATGTGGTADKIFGEKGAVVEKRSGSTDLTPSVPDETFNKVKSVFTDQTAIRTYDETDLLIKFDIMGRHEKSLTSCIVEVLKKAKWIHPCYLYTLAADWNQEQFFKQLLKDCWEDSMHEEVLRKLLKKDKKKYFTLITKHNRNSKWLTKQDGPLFEKFGHNKLYAYLRKKIGTSECNPGNEDEHSRITGKMLFIGCVEKRMPEAALIFWRQGQDCLAMALVAYCMSMEQKNALEDKEGFELMEKQTEFFSTLAINFARKCYGNNQPYTRDLFAGKVEDLDNLTPLRIALNANFEEFLFVAPIRRFLVKVWLKDVHDYDNKYITEDLLKFKKSSRARVRSTISYGLCSLFMHLTMVLSIACPLLAPWRFDIRINDSNNEKQTSKTAQSCKCVYDYFRRVGNFINTPFVQFTHGIISFIVYLTLFSIVLLTNFRAKISPLEIALSVWTLILIIEEVKQSIADTDEYWTSTWNYFDMGALTLYVIGFIMRMIYHGDPTICPQCLYVARIVLAFSLVIFFVRVLEFLSIYESLGPKIYMIRRLFGDLVGFMLILTVFISAYGVVSNVILYPNQPLNATLLGDVFYDAWWSIIQQFNMDASGSECNKNNVSAIYTAEYCSSTSDDNIDYVGCKENRCPANNWIVSVLLAFYALLTCIMLLNILIAMFNSTFNVIGGKQRGIAKLQRFRLIIEYHNRSRIPPPVCVITYACDIIIKLCKYLHHSVKVNNSTPDVEDGHSGEESKPSQNSLNPLENDATSLVKNWELFMAKEFYEKNKGEKGWPMPRMESEDSDL